MGLPGSLERDVRKLVAQSVLGWIRRARLLPILGMVAVAVLLAGCGANGAADPLLAAKVNGKGITLSNYQQLLNVYRAIDKGQYSLPTDWRIASQRADLASTQKQVLDSLINIELLRQQLSQQHITVSAHEYQVARDALQGQIAADQKQLAQETDPTQRALLKSLLDSITPDVISVLSQQGAMQTALQQRGKLPAVHMRGIETKDMQTAQKLQQQAESGSDFAALARANSLNKTSGAQGGELGTAFVGEISTSFARAVLNELPVQAASSVLGTFSTQFDKAVFAHGAHPGKYVILPFQSGYWLFELTDLGPHPLSTLSNTQALDSVFAAWLTDVVFPTASIEEYVTVG